MSMPGFYFQFSCRHCQTRTERTWPLYVFPTLFESTLCLPTWSRALECYGELILDLPRNRRTELERDIEALQSFAHQLSTPLVTVGVPRMSRASTAGRPHIEVVPEPCCPHCGSVVQALWCDQFE